jgi:hypothetical protein
LYPKKESLAAQGRIRNLDFPASARRLRGKWQAHLTQILPSKNSEGGPKPALAGKRFNKHSEDQLQSKLNLPG